MIGINLKLSSIAVAGLILILSLPITVSASSVPSLSVSSATAAKGSSVTVTVSLDTAGTPVYAYQADLTYPTSYFSSASITMADGSPFTVSPGSSDPDIASGGNIHFTRFYTSTKNYSGAIATITLKSNGTAGTTAINFRGICANTTWTSNCSTLADGSNTQLLGSVSNGTVKLVDSVSGSSKGAAASSSKGSKSKGNTTSGAGTANQLSSAQDTKKSTDTSEEYQPIEHKVVLTVLDQDGKPLKNAKVILEGVSGTTDANGKVAIRGLSEGRASGNVIYNGQTVPINVIVEASQSIQNAKVNVKIKKSSILVPAGIGIGVAILGIVAVLLVVRRPKRKDIIMPPNSAAPRPAPPSTVNPVAAHTETPKPAAVPAPIPKPKPIETKIEPPRAQPRTVDTKTERSILPEQPRQEEPRRKPENSLDSKPLHEKAMDPGTIVVPSGQDA